MGCYDGLSIREHGNNRVGHMKDFGIGIDIIGIRGDIHIQIKIMISCIYGQDTWMAESGILTQEVCRAERAS